MLNSDICLHRESHKNREVLYVKSLENVQIPFLEILGSYVLCVFGKGKGTCHWGLISCFLTSTFTHHPIEKALMFLHWEYWASKRISGFPILFLCRETVHYFQFNTSILLIINFPCKGECHLCLPGRMCSMEMGDDSSTSS